MPEAAREVSLTNQYGLHARPASRIVGIASRYRCDVTLSNGGGRAVNAKSILEVLTLASSSGTTLKLRAVGDDAEQAVAELAELIAGRFGEE